MSKVNWKIISMSVIFPLAILLTGCDDGSGSNARLNVSLNTHPETSNDIHQKVQLDLQGINQFQIEILDAQSRSLDFRKIDVPADSQSVQADFLLKQAGSYQVRSSAFAPNGALLGTTSKTLQIQPGSNQLDINTLGLSNLYYADHPYLSQTQSPDQLEKFLSLDQPGISLQAYCFFGYLGDDKQDRLAYFSLIQRLGQAIDLADSQSVRLPFIMAGTGISNPSLGGFRTGGTLGAALMGNSITLNQPWDLSITSPNEAGAVIPTNETRAQLVSGTLGQKGAQYKISSHGIDDMGRLMTTEVLVKDTFGFVNEGFGANAFLPNWLLPEQEQAIRHDYGGAVDKYLATTQNPLTGQGSYYYSAPFLEVVHYKISYDQNGTVVSQGTGGLLWMDVVYQTFDQTANEIIKDASWSFFIMQFPKQKKAIMTTLVKTKVSDYRVSSLFGMDAPQDANGVLEPEYRWNLQDINMQPVSGSEWVSPESGEKYYTQYKINLGGAHTADLTVTMAWNAQEVKAGTRFVYEGLSDVTGMLDGQAVDGTAWLEMQPIGKLN